MIAKLLTEIEWLEKCPISMISNGTEISHKQSVLYRRPSGDMILIGVILVICDFWRHHHNDVIDRI